MIKPKEKVNAGLRHSVGQMNSFTFFLSGQFDYLSISVGTYLTVTKTIVKAKEATQRMLCF